MADGSPLPFPSPSAILGADSAATTAAAAADSALELPANRKKDTSHARRPSNNKETKKTAPPRPNKAPAVDASVVKPKQTKSRNGCATCKQKRLKCGEEKPTCQNCAKRNVPCGGYKKIFQWRDFSEQPGMIKNNIARQKQVTSTSPNRRPLSLESSKATTPSNELPPRLPSAPNVKAPAPSASRPPICAEGAPDRPHLPRRRTTSPRSTALESHDSPTGSPSQQHQPQQQSGRALSPESKNYASDEFGSVNFDSTVAFAYRSRSLSVGPNAGSMPTMTEFMHGEQAGEDTIHQDFVPFSMPEDMQLPLWSAGNEDHGLIEDELVDDQFDMMGPLLPMGDESFTWPSRLNTPTQSGSPLSPAQGIPSWDRSSPYLYSQPNFPVDSPEHLLMRFHTMTCGILSIMDGPTENPWRSLIWPMTQYSPALYHAIIAMAAFHSSKDVPGLRMVGHEHKHASIRNIQEGIRDNSMTDQMAIATALALGFAESWDQLTATGNTHIKGAQALVKRALEAHRRVPLVGADLKRLKFLCNAWVYMDVMARLTSVDSDESNDFDSLFLFAPDAPNVFLGRNRNRHTTGFGINFGMPVDARLDPLMGCAGSLFPVIGRVANLVRKVCRSQTNSPGIVSHARDLKKVLDDWDPPEEIEAPEDPSTEVQHTLQTAEAYRWATLLHLHQSVPELPSQTSAHLSQKVLAALATVPIESRTLIVQIYPLMVAGCEAQDPEDRQWIEERWLVMADRMRIGVIDKCLEVTKGVWKRKDRYEAKPINHRKLVRTSELDPAKRKGMPFARKPLDTPAADPGQVGVVFSYVDNNDNEPMVSRLKDLNGPEAARRRMDISDRVKVDPAYSVRGHLHWVGVMWDWAWEILLA